MNDKGKWSIPTEYGGTKYRSKLEADWARFFDQHHMTFAYEAEGFDLNGLWYLPDFWLPQIKTIVEVKGVLDERSETKLYELAKRAARRDVMVILAESPVPSLIRLIGPSPQRQWGQEIFTAYDDVGIARCSKCKSWYFLDQLQVWKCTACGFYMGDSTFDHIHPGNRDWFTEDCPDCGMKETRPEIMRSGTVFRSG